MSILSIFSKDYLSLVSPEIRPYLERFDNETNLFENYKTKIDTLESQFSSVLEDYKTAYISYKIAPTNPDYATNFNDTTSKLSKISEELLALQQTIQLEIEKINVSTGKINLEITKEKETRDELLRELSNIKGANAGSKIMISNFKEMYRKNYYTNTAMFVGILGSLFLLYKVSQYPSVFNKNPVIQSPNIPTK